MVVLGAGPAGLMAAWHAARAGREVVVLERSSAVGGLAGSFDVAGLRVDWGSHRLHPSTPPAVLEELEALLGADLQVRPRNGRIRLGDRWLAFPLRTGDLLRGLPRPVAARAAMEAASSPLRRARSDDFASVVRAGLGPTVSRQFYEPYARKLWGLEASQLDGELARRRVSANSPLAIARRLVRGSKPQGRTFLYPRRGFGQIPEVIADAAATNGAAVMCGTAVESVRVGAREVVVGTSAGEWSAPVVLSTLPLGALVDRVHPAAPSDVTAAMGCLEMRAMALVYVVVDRAQVTEFDAHYLPAAEVAVARLSEPRNYRDGGSADLAGVTVLCAEVPCDVGDATWSSTDADLGELVVDSMVRSGLDQVEVADVVVRRVPHLYPVYRSGFQAPLAEVERWVDALPGIVTLGRHGLFTPDNTHHALMMGAAAARALPVSADEAWDARGWAASRETFRAHVVED